MEYQSCNRFDNVIVDISFVATVEISTACRKKRGKLQAVGIPWSQLGNTAVVVGTALGYVKPVPDNAGHFNRSGVLYSPVLDSWLQ